MSKCLPASERLTTSQLTDLVNYTLELPVRLGYRGCVVHPAVDCCVVRSWPRKRMDQVQVWCELQLRKDGIFGPIPPTAVGRRPGCSVIPPEVARWMISRRRYAA
jgi:hypothetical protein